MENINYLLTKTPITSLFYNMLNYKQFISSINSTYKYINGRSGGIMLYKNLLKNNLIYNSNIKWEY